jgi:signal transduction histidine kinase/Fe-S-cluster-containing hydrogenase component 2
MGIVSTIPEKCRRCYACVRDCPAKAIKVEHGQALVIEERCIACGNCVKVCTQNAKRIQDGTEEVSEMLRDGKRVFACLAPSFPAAFDTVAPGKVISAVRRLGFEEVWSVAFGAELVAREYAKLFARCKEMAAGPVIATPCPALVAYVEKYMPDLRGALAPIVSPMIATARAIRRRHGENVLVVFIGPCIAKKNEISDPSVAGQVDAVLTFRECVCLMEAAGIVAAAEPESDFDGCRSLLGGSFPLSGGLLKTSGVIADVLDDDIVTAEGKDRALIAIQELATGLTEARFFDVLFCEGCINGPRMLNELGLYARRERLAKYVNEQRGKVTAEEFQRGLAEFRDLSLERSFTPQNLVLPRPSEEEIASALREMRKFAPEDQLNCGACGYPTCREKAIAVCQGLAEASMCLPFLVDELEATCRQLQASSEELESTHQRLVQTERLASMGQLSAGVAHEINNPLGTVLIYSHMLLRHLQGDNPIRGDLEMIVNEASRCKKIVRGLLDFARQSRVSKAPTDLAAMIDEIRTVMLPRAERKAVRLITHVDGALPTMMIDGDQIKQMLINLVGNGIDATEKPDGEVSMRTWLRTADNHVVIEVTDNGSGISQENLSKLFTPFFTTKGIGQGTGLGLAIAYGIVKMHSGDIRAESEIGKGTTFRVSLPVGQEGAEPPVGRAPDVQSESAEERSESV